MTNLSSTTWCRSYGVQEGQRTLTGSLSPGPSGEASPWAGTEESQEQSQCKPSSAEEVEWRVFVGRRDFFALVQLSLC